MVMFVQAVYRTIIFFHSIRMHGEYIDLSDTVFTSSADMTTNYYSWEDIFKTE